MAPRGLWWIGLVMSCAFVAACSVPNPRSCLDGLCSDPAFPFCDVDGAIGGTAGTCIAVTCEPGTVDACRADSALVCSSQGGNYDVVPCPRGCDAALEGGCRECSEDEHCPAQRPICGASGTCGGCTADDECASGVCHASMGTCAAPSEVVYAAPLGTAGGSCDQANPCALDRAIVVATAPTTPLIVRLTPGTYATPLSVTTPHKLLVVATGALFGDGSRIIANAGADLTVRGFEYVSSVPHTTNIECWGSTSVRTRLSLLDGTMDISGGSGIELTRCDLELERVRLAAESFSFNVYDEGSVRAVRTWIRGHKSAPWDIVAIAGTRITLLNSVLEDVALALGAVSPMPSAPPHLIAYSTLVGDGARIRFSNGPSSPQVRAENSVFFSSAGSAAPFDYVSYVSSLSYPVAPRPPGVVEGEPRFVDLAGSDFRLAAGSPAIDAATLGSPQLDVNVDFTGASRPIGAAKDIGAFEHGDPTAP